MVTKAQRAKKAAEWVERMKQYPIGKSYVYSSQDMNSVSASYTSEYKDIPKVTAKTTMQAIYAAPEGANVCALNFADYKSPGGGFLKGLNAQEENLCSESNLYNILSSYEDYYGYNRQKLNRGLYLDRAIYSEDVMCQRNNIEHKVAILTCAAPNWNAAHDKATAEENNFAFRLRIEFVKQILLKHRVDYAILGAWGCGVFKQNPICVANWFKEIMQNVPFACEYAVPIFNGKDTNYKAFKLVFNGK